MGEYLLRAVAHCKEGAWLLSRVRPETAPGRPEQPVCRVAYTA
jgi:hypothetical protein